MWKKRRLNDVTIIAREGGGASWMLVSGPSWSGARTRQPGVQYILTT